MFLFRQRGFLVGAILAAICLFRGSVARGGTDTQDDNFREDVIECEQTSSAQGKYPLVDQMLSIQDLPPGSNLRMRRR